MKNQKNNLLLALLSLTLFFYSCEKYQKGNTVLKVEVVNGVTNEPYEDVKIKVDEETYYEDPSGGPGGYVGFNEHVGHSVTNADGRSIYSFNAKASDEFSYVFNLWGVSFYDNFASETFGYFEGSPDSNIEKGVVNNKVVKIVKIIKCNWHIKNTNCIGADDKIEIRYKGLYHDWWVFHYLPDDGLGCIDFHFPFTQKKQDELIIEKTVFKNGTTTVSLDTVMLLGDNGVDTVEIFY